MKKIQLLIVSFLSLGLLNCDSKATHKKDLLGEWKFADSTTIGLEKKKGLII